MSAWWREAPHSGQADAASHGRELAFSATEKGERTMADPVPERVRIASDRGGSHEPGVLPSWCTLDGLALRSSCADGIAIESLKRGTALDVETLNSQYRIVVMDGPRHLVLMQGGKMFPEATLVRLDGATAGGSALKIGWISAGLKLEISIGRRRITSSVVRSVAVSSVPPEQCGDDSAS
jgi:hypothetical protein